MTYVEINGVRIDRIVANQIPLILNQVLKKDRDKHLLIDGREGGGKSKLARQLAKALDPTFNIDKISFNGYDFIRMIKDPARKKGEVLILDEAYNAANSRAALSDINRAMVGVATEMRQLNLIIIVVLPTFFDLDKYFAIWRTETLFHCYFDEDGDRGQYVIYPFNDKLSLYIRGKKLYNYRSWKSPYPPCKFPRDDPIDETEYNKRKLQAFRKRPLTIMERKWKERALRFAWHFKQNGTSMEELGEIGGIKWQNLEKSLGNWRNDTEKQKNILLKLSQNRILLDEEEDISSEALVVTDINGTIK